MRRNYLTAILAAVSAAFLAEAPAMADVADFYRGKNLTVIVPAGSGGTFHIYGQLVQRHLGKHVPGNPSIIVKNMPGAGGVKAAAYMTSAAPKDGTVIAEINPGSVIVPLLRNVDFDPRAFNWIGTLSVRTYTLAVWNTVKANTIEAHKKTQINMAASGAGSISYQLPTFLNAVLGTKYKLITGYKGGGAMNLAMERGEVDGRGNFYSGYLGAKPDWIRDKKVKIFATIGPVRPEVKDVPRLSDMVKGDINRKMLGLVEVGFNIGQAFYMPPGTPEERVAAMRKAFTAMLKDKDLLAEAAKRNVPVNPRTWEDNVKVVNEAFNVEPEVPEKLAEILGFDKKK